MLLSFLRKKNPLLNITPVCYNVRSGFCDTSFVFLSTLLRAYWFGLKRKQWRKSEFEKLGASLDFDMTWLAHFVDVPSFCSFGPSASTVSNCEKHVTHQGINTEWNHSRYLFLFFFLFEADLQLLGPSSVFLTTGTKTNIGTNVTTQLQNVIIPTKLLPFSTDLCFLTPAGNWLFLTRRSFLLIFEGSPVIHWSRHFDLPTVYATLRLPYGLQPILCATDPLSPTKRLPTPATCTAILSQISFPSDAIRQECWTPKLVSALRTWPWKLYQVEVFFLSR